MNEETTETKILMGQIVLRKSDSGFVKTSQGSAKDIWQNAKRPEEVLFVFADRISVFDYGALPDEIPGKGAAQARSAHLFFDLVEAHGIATARIKTTNHAPDELLMTKAFHQKFDKPELKTQFDLDFVPVEVIFRLGAPRGSSWLSRHPDVKPGTWFESPVVEFSTKLEASDRLLSQSEAAGLVGSEEACQNLQALTSKIAGILKSKFAELGLELWDGKLEWARSRKTGDFVLLDAITLDEVRVSLKGLSQVALSKELLRSWLAPTPWGFTVKQAKKTGRDDWKTLLTSPPPRLGPWRIQTLAGLYEAFTSSLETKSSAPLFSWVRSDQTPPMVHVVGQGGRESALRARLENEGCLISTTLDNVDAILVSRDSDLAEGLADQFRQSGKWTFGPGRDASKIEWSKAFGRDIAIKAGIPCPQTSINTLDLKNFSEPPVIKQDGLAAGKGVVVCETWDEAKSTLDLFTKNGAPVVMEERLRGFEASAFFFVSTGYGAPTIRFLGCAQDFKRRFVGDEGPNTGGMGALSPHPKVTNEDLALFDQWAQSLAQTFESQKLAYHGIVYMGCMKDHKQGWKLLEFNARFGDPETQALVCSWPKEALVLRSLLGLDRGTFRWPATAQDGIKVLQEQSAVCVALVHPSYPTPPSPALAISKLPTWTLPIQTSAQLFLSGSLSGRVAYLVGQGRNLQEAGDEVFGLLVECPWNDLLEWRADLLS